MDIENKPPSLEDPLSYLPRVMTREFRDGEAIYNFDTANTHLYLVIEGFVSVVRKNGNTEVVMDLCQRDEFFGESSLVQSADGEAARAIGPTKVMRWPASSVTQLMMREAGMGVAVAQMLACRCVSLEGRIAALSADSTKRRLAKALLYLAQRFGEPVPDAPQMRRMIPFSHNLLAQYIGCTRAAATRSLIQLRREKLILYSRKEIVVNFVALRATLHEYRGVPSSCLEKSAE